MSSSERSRRISIAQRRRRRFQFEQLERRELLTAGLDPVVFIPGFGGSFAASQTDAGINEWHTNRGLAPTKLVLDPFTNSYDNIIQSLKNVGYVENSTLFVANWDWRMRIAPVDSDSLSRPDGLLSNVTAPTIVDKVDGTFASGLDYFGNALKLAKTANPLATKVDVIAHDAGGLIARSYIQSNAYGGVYDVGLSLPTIDDLVMVGVPNEGVVDSWSFLHDDFNASTDSRSLAMMLEHAYTLVQTGTAIHGPDGDITNSPPISKETFIQRYVGSLRDLLPTYQAIDTNNDGAFENLEPRWIEQGPNPVLGGPVIASPNNQVNGAIDSIAFHPTNKDIAYAGAVSGGVWRTDNFRDPKPTWVPLTDDQSSLSTGSIAVSPLDETGNTVFVGTASLSGFDQSDGLKKGLLVTVDGGITWNNVAPANAFGGSIFKILPTIIGNDINDQIVLVAAENGISRSTNGGTTWTLKSGTSGLPTGYATDIISDPNNPSRYYAAIPGSGVYVSTNTGANWSRIDNNAGFSISGIAGSSNIGLAIHDAGTTSVLYVGVVGATDELTGVFRDVQGGDGVDNDLTNGIDEAAEFQFTAIGKVPAIHQIKAGQLFFGIVADPTSPNDVYIGGEFSPQLFRGNAVSNTWTSITDANANDSAPHARVRSLTFQDDTTLVSTSEGGIYRLDVPITTNGTWTSAGGNINAFETISLAYDPTPGVLLAGTQDNGAIKQMATGSLNWERTSHGRGVQAHDRINDVDYSVGGNFDNILRIDSEGIQTYVALGANTVHHPITNAVASQTNPITITSVAHGLTTGQAVHINVLFGMSYDGAGIIGLWNVTVIDANTFSLDNTVQAVGTYEGGSSWVLAGLDNLGGSTSDQQVAIAGVDQDYENDYKAIPLATNAVRGNSILFGRIGLYESVNSSGDVIVSLTSLLTGKTVDERINSIVYGGRRAGIDHPEIFYVSTNGGKLYRRDESNTVSQLTIPGIVGIVTGIAVDPDDWQHAFVVVGGRIFATVNAGNTWTEISDNLATSFPTANVRAIAFASDTNTSQVGDGELFIAGLGGVFRRSASATAGANWSIAAVGLPNTIVEDLHYEKTNNTLYAATLGRGAWSLEVGVPGNTLANNLITDLSTRWIEQGPSPVLGGSAIASPNNQVNGAIDSIAFHPTNEDIAYAGAVSGGVWRTDNFRAPNPTWVPLTDDLASLSTGSIAVSPLDETGNTVFVGTASLSGLVQPDALNKGLLVTVDGGNSWNNVAPASAFGGSILKILPTIIGNDINDQIVLVAAANGISRSTNGGTTWTLKSGTSGLPTGYATDIIADPNNPSRYYAAIPGSGVYVSTNTGANWSRIDNNAGFSISGIAGSSNIGLAIHDAGTTSVLYVGVVGATDELTGVFRDVQGGDGIDNNSTNGVDDAAEFRFIGIGTVPAIHQLQSGLLFFGIVADPTSPNDVYIGGEFSPQLFRGNAVSNTWTSITGANAFDSTPHHRVRSLMFHDDTTLVSTSEGGIHRLDLPLTTDGIWTSAGGNINALETISLAYDPTPGVLLAGTQDNGSIKQITEGSLNWQHTDGGRGVQAHDRINDVDYSAGGNFDKILRIDSEGNETYAVLGANAVHHPITNAVASSTNPVTITSAAHGLTTGQAVHINALFGMEYDGFGIFGFYNVTVIDANTFSLANTVQAVGTYQGGSSWVLAGLDNLGGSTSDQQVAIEGVDREYENDYRLFPLVTNSVRGNSILFGRNGLYESVNSSGDVIVSLTSLLTGKAVNDRINAIVYGGRRDGVDHPEIFYVGTSEGKLYRRDESNAVSQITIPGAVGSVNDIAVDPDDWQQAFVVVGDSTSRVFATEDGGNSWSEITENLATSFPSAFVQTIAFASDTNTSQVGGGELFVAGLGGVFRRSATAPDGTNWSISAVGLPNTIIEDLHYEKTNNTLYAATLGRGVWSFELGASGNKLVNKLLTDLNAGSKNAWINGVTKAHVIYSSEVDTRDQILTRRGP